MISETDLKKASRHVPLRRFVCSQQADREKVFDIIEETLRGFSVRDELENESEPYAVSVTAVSSSSSTPSSVASSSVFTSDNAAVTSVG